VVVDSGGGGLVVVVVVVNGGAPFPAAYASTVGVLSANEAEADEAWVETVVVVVVVVGAPGRAGGVAGFVRPAREFAAVWMRSGRPLSP
jgi:hypothetical protein